MKKYWKKHQRMVNLLARRNKFNEDLIKKTDPLYKYSLDMIVMMTPLLIIGFYLNGFNAIRVAFWGVVSAVVTEYIACRIMKKDSTIGDLSAAATGLAISLMLPAVCPSYIPAIGSAFAIAIAKVPFGGARKAPFTPAAVGFAFLCVCFPEAVFTYAPITVGTSSPLFGSADFIAGTSFGEMLSYGKSINLNELEIFSILGGVNPGPIGTTCMVALLGSAVYLIAKRPKKAAISFSFIFACAIMAIIFPRVNSGLTVSLIMELSSGTLIFVALILAPNPVSAPRKLLPSMLYGFSMGIICMLIRYFGKYSEGACFSILIMNAITPVVTDYYTIIKNRLDKKSSIKAAFGKDKQQAKLEEGGNDNG